MSPPPAPLVHDNLTPVDLLMSRNEYFCLQPRSALGSACFAAAWRGGGALGRTPRQQGGGSSCSSLPPDLPRCSFMGLSVGQTLRSGREAEELLGSSEQGGTDPPAPR